jgi:hypothetical protein
VLMLPGILRARARVNAMRKNYHAFINQSISDRTSHCGRSGLQRGRRRCDRRQFQRPRRLHRGRQHHVTILPLHFSTRYRLVFYGVVMRKLFALALLALAVAGGVATVSVFDAKPAHAYGSSSGAAPVAAAAAADDARTRGPAVRGGHSRNGAYGTRKRPRSWNAAKTPLN